MKRLLEWLCCEPGEKIVRIKSLWPSFGPHGVEWPVLLVDTRLNQRMTIAPVWDRVRIKLTLIRGRE
jgi:hypothetical protein